MPNHYPGNFLFAQDSDLAPFFGELSKIEKLARIKPTLTLIVLDDGFVIFTELINTSFICSMIDKKYGKQFY